MSAESPRSGTPPRPNPRRVLFVITTSDVGGTERYLANLVAGLDRQRFEPLVCSLCPTGAEGQRIAATGVQVISLEMAARARPIELVRGVQRLTRLIDRQEIDLVQALLYRANMMSALSGRLARRSVRVIAGQRSLSAMTGRRAALGVRWTRRLVDHTVAVSAAVRGAMIDGEGVDPQRVTVIGNAVDHRRFRPRDRTAAQQALELAPSGLLVGAVGRLSDAKGFDHLLAACARARAEGCDLELVLAGDGPLRQDLTARASQLDISDRVHFLGRRNGLERIYPAFDLFVLSSLQEGSPNVVLEALASGVAVVATRVGGVPELLEDGRSGLLVPPADPDSLAEALVRLARNGELRQRLADAGRQHVERHLTLGRMVAQHEQLYERLLAEP